MDQISIRKESARIAAQLEGVTSRNFITVAKRIERYIKGSVTLPENISVEYVTREAVRQTLNELTDANDAIRQLNEMDKEFHGKYKELALPQDNISKINENTATGRKENLYAFTNGLAMCKPHNELHQDDMQRHDPNFASHLMKTFAAYPSISEELSEIARQRQLLYHDMGIAPEPFNDRHPNQPVDNSQAAVYLAPGGMPSSEGESIYLQRKGDLLD